MLSNEWLTVPGIGTLFICDIHYYYDEPLIFTAQNNAYNYYFVLAIDDDKWLLSEVSPVKYTQIRNNLVSLRNIYTDSETGFVFRVSLIDDDVVPEIISIFELTDDELPEEGAFLDRDITTQNIDLSESEILEKIKIGIPEDPLPQKKYSALSTAQLEKRDVIDISLLYSESHIHEISCETLSKILDGVQKTIYSLSNKDGGKKGKIPREIKELNTLQVTSMFAASFGIRMKSNELSNIEGETSLSAPLSEFYELIENSDSKEWLSQYFKNQNPGVVSNYQLLLRSLIKGNTSFGIDYASPNKKAKKSYWPLDSLAVRLKVIEEKMEEEVVKKEFYGRLVGINVEDCSFSFSSVDKELIKGKLSVNMSTKEFKIPMHVKIVVEERLEINKYTDEIKKNYCLLEYEEIIKS